MKRNIKMTKPQKPADLDNTRLHTREEISAWQESTRDYHAAIRAEEQRAATQAAAKAAEANRPLTDDEYRAAAVIRETAKRARIAEQEATEKAKQEAKAEYLSSTPDFAEIDSSNPHSFLLEVIHWSGKGYSMPEGADLTVFPNWYAVKLVAPAPAAKKAK
jgi:molecular chaperone GrpE (heat shock protein)